MHLSPTAPATSVCSCVRPPSPAEGHFAHAYAQPSTRNMPDERDRAPGLPRGLRFTARAAFQRRWLGEMVLLVLLPMSYIAAACRMRIRNPRACELSLHTQVPVASRSLRFHVHNIRARACTCITCVHARCSLSRVARGARTSYRGHLARRMAKMLVRPATRPARAASHRYETGVDSRTLSDSTY
jgi:hypothetical protein